MCIGCSSFATFSKQPFPRRPPHPEQLIMPLSHRRRQSQRFPLAQRRPPPLPSFGSGLPPSGSSWSGVIYPNPLCVVIGAFVALLTANAGTLTYRVMGVVIAHDFVDDADEMREAAIIDDGTGGIAVAPSQLLMSTNIMRRIPPGTMIEVSGILCMPTAPSEHRWIHSYGITAKTDPHAELIRLDEVIQLYSEDYFKGKFAGATAPPSFTQPPPGLFGNRKRPASTTPRAPAASSYRPQNAFSSPLRGPFQPAGTPRKTLGIARMAAGSSATPPSRKLAGDGGGLGRPTPPPKPFKPPMAAFQQTAAAESPARALCASPSVVAQAAATLQDVDSFLQTKQGLGVSRGDVLAAFPRTSHSVIDGILNELLSEGIAYISESLYFPL
ncbi:hypothetical protein DFJ73DRAFT_77836 [Zopfochytrium polystomum]|nr:hypothetical protein DFJ73DRAFT_77836 [Zopfochytrium polystomum]